jgi:cobalt-precorrin-5B (C1)-methyltransferase
MIGKLSKITAGKMQTHVAGNQVDFAFLAQVAEERNAPRELIEQVRQANSARHVQELVDAAKLAGFYQRLCELAAQQCLAQVAGKLAVDVVLFDFEGQILARVSPSG